MKAGMRERDQGFRRKWLLSLTMTHRKTQNKGKLMQDCLDSAFGYQGPCRCHYVEELALTHVIKTYRAHCHINKASITTL